MKNIRRILCLFLALCVVSVCPLNALAVSDNGENMEISGEQVYIVRQGEVLEGDYEILADGEWTFVESNTYSITWAQALGSAAAISTAGKIASAIAAKIPGIGAGAVLIAIGADNLALLAGACGGGSLYVEFYTYTFPGQPIQYMYKWTFTAWTGDSFGPFRFIMDNQVASIGDDHELQ